MATARTVGGITVVVIGLVLANINTTDSICTHLFNGSASKDMDRLDGHATRPTARAVPLIG